KKSSSIALAMGSGANPTRRYLAAAVASALMAFNPEMIVWARVGVSDMLLTGCIASALLCLE
ncbi:hypothetical protein, partial [Klebsiella aerogenes]|uniref:hypothetical protein n=1 Tax=Klebsiella aerogenes TaxID=548 RepID=UPI0013D5E63D